MGSKHGPLDRPAKFVLLLDLLLVRVSSVHNALEVGQRPQRPHDEVHEATPHLHHREALLRAARAKHLVQLEVQVTVALSRLVIVRVRHERPDSALAHTGGLLRSVKLELLCLCAAIGHHAVN